MLLHVVQKHFSDCNDVQECSNSLCPLLTQLTTYNGAPGPHLKAHDSLIDSIPDGYQCIMLHAHIWYYVADTPVLPPFGS